MRVLISPGWTYQNIHKYILRFFRMETEQIRLLIQAGFPGDHVEVDGDGRHFSTIVVSELFSGKSMLQQHQLVYQSLGGRVGTEIHALSIRTYTPDQWKKDQDLRVI